MGIKVVVCFLGFLLLHFALSATALDGKKRIQELSPGNLIDWEKINENTAELLWVNCRLELVHAKEAIEDLELYVSEEKSSCCDAVSSKGRLSAKENIKKAASALHPHIEQTLMDCLRKKNLMFLVSGEEKGSENSYTKYLESWFVRLDGTRRRKLIQSTAETRAPSPAIASPISSPAPSNSEVPNSQRPTGPPLQPFFPRDFNDSSSQPTSGGHSSASSNSASNVQSNKQRSNRKTVVVAVIVTAGVTFVVAALLFLCWRRCCGPASGVGKNDERPLLSLSLSEPSVGSSKQSLYTTSSLGSNFHSQSDTCKTSKVPSGTVASAAITLAENSAPVPASPLKPPPGRLVSPGIPLNPPPGRPDPSVSPLAKAAPPPAPPPVPPPFSGGPRPPPPGPPPPPPIASGIKAGPRPPPPPGSGIPPPRPPPIGLKPPRPLPLGPNHPSSSASSEGSEADSHKTKLKPFFWDKVLANPDNSMVWHQIKSGSFQFNEEMIETLFGYAPDQSKNETKKQFSSQDPSTQFIQIINPKKSQNLAILLRALNVKTEEVCDALQEGNELPSELLQTLIKMAPTTDEELKLRLYNGEISRLGPPERFLKVLVDIPFAFKRIESLLFMCTLQEEASMIKESFATLEAACTELRKSRLFFKLLEAVLKTGNRMNDGTFRGGAQAFKLDTLLKLSDVKGKDGKTTLLHFVVQEIIRSEGIRAARQAQESKSMSSIKSDDLLEDTTHDSEEHYCRTGLQVVSGLSGELENVKKAAVLDTDSLTGNVAKLGHALIKARDFLNSEMKNIDEENGFHQTLKGFVQNAEVDIMWLLEEEKRIMALVKSTADYFHGNAGKDEGLRLFVIVRDFLIILDKVCKEVKATPRKPDKILSKGDSTVKPPSDKALRKEDATVKPSSEPHQSPPDLRQWIFPAIQDRRMDSSSSDDDTP